MLSVNGHGGTVVLTCQDLGALPCPDRPQVGALLRISAVDTGSGSIQLDTVSPSPALRTDPTYGLDTRPDGTLTTTAATDAQLQAMTDLYAPLTPGRTPYAVKQVLTAFAPRWTPDEKAAVRAALGITEGGTDPGLDVSGPPPDPAGIAASGQADPIPAEHPCRAYGHRQLE